MKNQKILLIVSGAVILLLIVGVGLWARYNKPANSGTADNGKVAGAETVPYYSENAKVMEFYSDYCGWCIKEKDILSELAKQGYQVKPMDVGKHTEYWQQYGIEGTPTFIAPDGTKLVGYQNIDQLKAFLDKYK